MKINEIISNDEAKPLNKEIKQWITDLNIVMTNFDGYANTVGWAPACNLLT